MAILRCYHSSAIEFTTAQTLSQGLSTEIHFHEGQAVDVFLHLTDLANVQMCRTW